MNTKYSIASLALAASLCAAPAFAQIAGGTVNTDVVVTESMQLAAGWSVRKTLMGKAVYNDAGAKVGVVEDLIISPGKSVSYVIVGAGGFLGIGHHDVAIPVAQIQDQSGKLVMAGATKDSIKALPPFEYASDPARRQKFVADAERDIASGKAKVAELEKKAGTSATDAKAKIEQEAGAIQADVKSAESRLAEMKDAGVQRWREFEAGVSAATARLRRSVETSRA